MKRIFLMLISGLFLLMFASKSFSENYLGEFCWQVFDEEGKPYWSYQFGVYEKVGGHLVLWGAVNYQANGISASHGNAIFVGDNIKLTIVSADLEENNQVWSESFAAKLDKATLGGSWNALGIERAAGNSEVIAVHSSGTITLVDCQ